MSRRQVVAVTLVALLSAWLTVPALALAHGTAKTPSATKTSSATPTATADSATAATTPALPGSSPLGGGVTAPGPVQTAPATSSTATILSATSTSGSRSLSGGSAIGIAVGAFVVLGGIAFFIWRDARRRAPTPAAAGPETPRIPGSKRPAKARKLSPAERRRRKRGRAR